MRSDDPDNGGAHYGTLLNREEASPATATEGKDTATTPVARFAETILKEESHLLRSQRKAHTSRETTRSTTERGREVQAVELPNTAARNVQGALPPVIELW